MEDQLGRLMSIQISNITLLTSVKAGQMAAAARAFAKEPDTLLTRRYNTSPKSLVYINRAVSILF